MRRSKYPVFLVCLGLLSATAATSCAMAQFPDALATARARQGSGDHAGAVQWYALAVADDAITSKQFLQSMQDMKARLPAAVFCKALRDATLASLQLVSESTTTHGLDHSRTTVAADAGIAITEAHKVLCVLAR